MTRSPAAATYAGRALRLIAGAALASSVVWALATPELPVLCKAAALLIAAAASWQPLWGLTLLTMLAPAGALFAAAPARAAELFAWSFIAAWLLSIWRPLSKAGWPRTVILPLALFAAALVASWLSLTIAGAAGVIPSALPRFLAGAIAGNHLVVSSPEAETWTLLQALGGLGVFVAATAVARDDSRTVRWVGSSLVASMTILAAATLVQLRDIPGDRFSLPLADVNAAGSLYALAAVISLGCAWFQPARRLDMAADAGPARVGRLVDRISIGISRHRCGRRSARHGATALATDTPPSDRSEPAFFSRRCLPPASSSVRNRKSKAAPDNP